MNTNEVLWQLDHLAGLTPTEKKVELRNLLTDTTFSRVIKFALDPFITFGVNKVPMPTIPANLDWQFGDTTWILLEQLATRRVTGNTALTLINEELMTMSPSSRKLLERILTKDLRCGVTAKTVNSVVPGTIPTFDCQLAHKYEQKHIKQWPVAVEPKYDGMRALLILEHSGGQFVSRTGKPFTAVQWLADEVHRWIFVDRNALLTPMSGMVIDGELVNPEGDFYAIGGARGKSEFRDAHFMAFDMLRINHFKKGHDPSPYRERQMALSVWVEDINHQHVKRAPVWYAGDHNEVMEYYSAVRHDGGEGVIVKPTDGDYRCTRSRNWLKIKDQQTVDAPIIGLEEGTGKYRGMLGAVIVDLEGVEVRVGSGFTDEQRLVMWVDVVRDNSMGRLIEIEYHEKTPDGSLRHPRFVRFRDDKPVEDGVGV
ncbi:ATP-dependent DNA ligase [Marinobacter nauticus]|uniref:ATP-dependent DNA ligase family profile domain-containing protein n=1 Tax=Marinobacter nauticus TaxID=2743 RepID=A0A833JQC0_MARNT|nr:RNA ligase family protein [Marinobacter nauticus]KAE8546122.1 hypothetical protein F6453_1368 [Marinobacter nauticus]